MNSPSGKARYTGGCLCGDVRYEISAEPLFGGHCQCRDCQRHTGAGHASSLGVAESAIKITGRLARYQSAAGSGNAVSRGFCPRCGSSLTFTSAGLPGMVLVSSGTLDDPSVFRPELAIYTSQGQAWDHLDPALTRFSEMPPRPRT